MTSLRKRRIGKSLYLREVAAEVGITPQMLGAVERHQRSAGLKLCQRLADFYGTAVPTMRALTRATREMPCPKRNARVRNPRKPRRR